MEKTLDSPRSVSPESNNSTDELFPSPGEDNISIIIPTSTNNDLIRYTNLLDIFYYN